MLENDTPIPTPEPLYVDARAQQRADAILDWAATDLANDFGISEYDAAALRGAKNLPYNGQGTLLSPFLTVDEARKVQKPGQAIVIAGYATIGPKPGV